MSLYPRHASAPVDELVIDDIAPIERVEVKWEQYPDDPPFHIWRKVGAVGLAAWAPVTPPIWAGEE